MKKRETLYALHTLMIIQVLVSGIFICFLLTKINAKETALYNIRPITLKQYTIPQQSHYAMGYFNSDFQMKQKNSIYIRPASVPGGDVFKIEAADAIDGIKYSQPDLAYSLLSLYSGLKVPSSTFSKHKLFQTPQNPPVNFQKESYPIFHASDKGSLKPIRDMKYLDLIVNKDTSSGVTNEKFSDKLENTNLENMFETINHDDKKPNLYQHGQSNFTDASNNLVSVPSDTVVSYEVPVTEFNHDSNIENSSLKQDSDIVNDVLSHDFANYNASIVSPESKVLQTESTTESSVQINTHTNMTNDLVSTSIFPSIISDENVTNSLPSTDSEKKLSSGTVAGIVIAVLICVTLLSSAVIYLLYKKFNGKCTSVVESKFNNDNCGYLDDSLHSSIYLNNHIELPKESSEEMTSLDNDSFLNSLETMTIQNYWTDSSKNTKV